MREEVLKFINDTISDWARIETIKYNDKIKSDTNSTLEPINLDTLRIKIFTFGSYK